MIVRATVRNGKFVIDEPAEFPEGTEVDLVLAEQPLDEMPADERAALLAQIDRGLAAIRQGEPGIPADQVLRALGG
ncbi:MAG: hypothetical protein IPJ34_28185 [Myxococcales bacterium]|nr:hypothetical protein [Myxococcales bacterium]